MLRPPHFQFTGSLLFAVLFLLALLFFSIFVPVRIVTEAFSRLGVTPWQGLLLLAAILIGRAVNIPLYRSQRLIMVPCRQSFEMAQDQQGHIQLNQQPANELKRQEFAVNFGGCILPLILSASFFLHSILAEGANVPDTQSLLLWAAVCSFVVAVACYALVRTDAVYGLRIPVLMPALVTVATVFLVVPHDVAPIVAYVSGTVGTIMGACFAPMLSARMRNSIAAPLVAFGGRGTFGGIFLAGILAVIFA